VVRFVDEKIIRLAGMLVNKKTYVGVIIAMLIICIASFFLGMVTQNIVYTKEQNITQTQNVIVQSPVSSLDNKKININKATLSELENLPGVGEVKARRIIDGRPYNDIYQLKDDNILGDKIFNSIEGMIYCD
jgi:DNA uptake protein ComE-like DNA-binding protein